MKWIFVLMAILPVSSVVASQYTVAECILVKQQIKDYKQRLGVNSNHYRQTKSNFDRYCQNPVSAEPKKNSIFRRDKSATVVKSQPTTQPLNLPKETITVVPKTDNSQPSLLIQSFKPVILIFLTTLFGLAAIAFIKRRLPNIRGWQGEQYVIKGLKENLDKSVYTIINDVTLPLADGGTTQIDHIVVSRFGVFVIETKNMSGWIFGNEKQAKWTQTIHRSKHQFQNPLRQNYKHTKALSELLNLPQELFHSVVVFTRNAEFKTIMPSNVGYLDRALTHIKAFNEEVIDHKLKIRLLKLIDMIRLEQGKKTNKQHIEYLNLKHSEASKLEKQTS